MTLFLKKIKNRSDISQEMFDEWIEYEWIREYNGSYINLNKNVSICLRLNLIPADLMLESDPYLNESGIAFVKSDNQNLFYCGLKVKSLYLIIDDRFRHRY